MKNKETKGGSFYGESRSMEFDDLKKTYVLNVKTAGEYLVENAENLIPNNVSIEYADINIVIRPNQFPEISFCTGHIPTRDIDRRFNKKHR